MPIRKLTRLAARTRKKKSAPGNSPHTVADTAPGTGPRSTPATRPEPLPVGDGSEPTEPLPTGDPDVSRFTYRDPFGSEWRGTIGM